jgi:hypothetical protein
MDIDVQVTGGGSVFLFTLLTDQASEWVADNVSDDRQMLGNGLAVEHRYAAAQADGIQADGFVVEVQ